MADGYVILPRYSSSETPDRTTIESLGMEVWANARHPEWIMTNLASKYSVIKKVFYYDGSTLRELSVSKRYAFGYWSLKNTDVWSTSWYIDEYSESYGLYYTIGGDIGDGMTTTLPIYNSFDEAMQACNDGVWHENTQTIPIEYTLGGGTKTTSFDITVLQS